MSLVWDTAAVGGSELLVLLAMADYANDDGTSIYPSVKSLAKRARLSEDQTRRIIHKLIADGVVELVEQGGWNGNRNKSNEYRIILDSAGKLQGGVLADCRDGTGVDARGGTRADASTVLAPMQEDPSYNHHKQAPMTVDALPAAPSSGDELNPQVLIKDLRSRAFMYIDRDAVKIAGMLLADYGWAACMDAADTTQRRHEDKIKEGERGIMAPLAYMRGVLDGSVNEAAVRAAAQHRKGPKPTPQRKSGYSDYDEAPRKKYSVY